MVRLQYVFLAVAMTAGVGVSGNEAAPDKPAPIPATIDFNRDIRGLISNHCYHCHGPDKGTRKAGLRLDLRESAVADMNGSFPIVPGDPSKSEVFKRLTSTDPDEMMPPPTAHEKMGARDVAVIRKWIEQGAPYAEHWSFVKPTKRPLPPVKTTGWARQPLDHFIAARLESEGLTPAAMADKHTLIRRASIDLTGLPPTPAEVDAFVADKSPDAFEKVVDRLLASPAFGERWARMWLDLARYADSAGYGSDPLRLNIWPFREWVISAFNRNQPFDQFTIEQLAGDLLPNATQDQILATAFHRNTMTNTEGGTDDEEFRVAAVKDRINTTMQVWMGLTMGCAQCHTHKFDPITQKEYYSGFAIFNQTEDADRGDEFPTLPRPTTHEKQKIETLKGQIEVLETALKSTPPELLAEVDAWAKEAATYKEAAWTPLEPLTFTSAGKTLLEKQPDQSLLASGLSPATDYYDISWRVTEPLTALRIDLLPHEKLPAKGPGRGANGDVAITEIAAFVKGPGAKPKLARFVRIELPGDGKMLHIAEVEVFSGGKNVATAGKATQSSTDYEGPANLAIDGKTNGDYNAKSVTHTKSEKDPWWEVDLGAELPIDEVVLWNRTDGGTQNRMNGVKIKGLDAARKTVFEEALSTAPESSAKIAANGWAPLKLAHASTPASGSDATSAIDNNAKSNWLVAGPNGRGTSLAFEIATPIKLEGPYELRLTIKQAEEVKGQKTIGRFLLQGTRQAHPVRLLPEAIRGALAVAPDARDAAQRSLLVDHFRPYAKAFAKTRTELAAKQKELAEVKPPAVPILRELPANKRRVSKILNKGNFLTPGDPVEPGVLAKFQPLPADAKPDRLGLARWIVAPENPLTARVAVNRFWSQLFGIGLVETEEDFGSQGQQPSHPELLDWLAVDFVERNWDTKALLKSLVLSASYQQASRVTPQMLEKDPRNRLLSHFPRRRLDAEQVRDQALALSGLLSPKIGGPSVFPPQPDGLWRAAFNGERTWSTSKGEDRYRRGMYTFWRRTVPYPSMATFDAPSREICSIRRIATNTPLQAFVTLNDPAFVECAQALGRRIIKEGGADVVSRVKFGLKLVLAREPAEAQVAALLKLYESELANYRKDAEAAKKLSTEPIGPLPPGMDAAEGAAWTVIGNVLLNLDGVLMKG